MLKERKRNKSTTKTQRETVFFILAGHYGSASGQGVGTVHVRPGCAKELHVVISGILFGRKEQL